MTDHFAVLDLPRRPLVDEEALKARYYELAARWHPDAPEGDSARFQSVREAYQALGDPAARWRHLTELEFPGTSIPTTGDPGLFMTVGGVIQQAREVLLRRDKAVSPLARALLVPDVARVRSQVKYTLEALVQARTQALEQAAALDAAWPAVDPAALARLASTAVFLGRWQAELGEWEFRLAQTGT